MRMLLIALALAPWCCFVSAQDQAELEDLKRERQELETRLQQTDHEIHRLESRTDQPVAEELREWEVELKHELDSINKYLVELPQDLSKYFVSMQDALNELLETIDQNWSSTTDAARGGLAEAERRYREARGRAFDENRLYDLQARAIALDAEQESAQAVADLQNALHAVASARENVSNAERELERKELEAELAARKLELLLLDIETRRMEESLSHSRN